MRTFADQLTGGNRASGEAMGTEWAKLFSPREIGGWMAMRGPRIEGILVGAVR
jgi:hypothetical protein